MLLSTILFSVALFLFLIVSEIDVMQNKSNLLRISEIASHRKQELEEYIKKNYHDNGKEKGADPLTSYYQSSLERFSIYEKKYFGTKAKGFYMTLLVLACISAVMLAIIGEIAASALITLAVLFSIKIFLNFRKSSLLKGEMVGVLGRIVNPDNLFET